MDYKTRREDVMKLKTLSSDVEEHPYVNTTIGSSRTASDKHESHIYEDVCRRNFDSFDFKVAKTGYFTRCKQHMNCVLLSLIGVLFAAVIALGIAIGLPEEKGVNGGWSIWGPWSPCSATCDFGTSHRERNCSNPIPENGGLACSGNAYELQLCNKITCPGINGGLTIWGPWSQCSATCDSGTTYRERSCSNPAPTGNGLFCSGGTTEFRLCNKAICPAVNGGWSVWSACDTCSATCGTGLQSWTRTCANPTPELHGRPRVAINGGWSDWSTWGTCSATCGAGLQSRARTCTNPAPEPRGRPCFGDVSDQQLCSLAVCKAIDGAWSAWSTWGTCSATCGTGLQSRNRTCSNPAPELNGRPCIGDFSDQQLCAITTCLAIDGRWSAWSAWGTCSATCGTGLQSRNRTCSNPAPELHGRPCVGDINDHQICAVTSCEGRSIGFSVYYTPNASATPVKFVNAYYNYNNVYNTTTGEFVCRKQGLYYFQSTFIRETAVDTSSPLSYCWLYRNSSYVQHIYIYSTYTYQQGTSSVVQYLLPGDRVYIGSCNNIKSLSYYSSFSGFLVST